MRAVDALDELNTRLTDLASRRQQASDQADHYALELGATIKHLRDRYGQSQAASGRRIGLAPARVSELVTRASEVDLPFIDPMNLVLTMDARAFPEYLRTRDDRIDRIVASFYQDDIPYAAGIHPLRFAYDSAVSGHLSFPQMVVHLEEADEWVGIQQVNVGYNGSGPGAVTDLLHRHLGMPEAITKRIAYSRFSDSDPRTGKGIFTDEDRPRYQLSRLYGHGTFLSTFIGVDQHTNNGKSLPRPFPGEESNQPQGTVLQRWIDFLDGPDRPDWTRGTRRARVFLNRQAAEAQGFVDPGVPALRRRRVAYIVIEQGDLQLWLHAYPPRDTTQYLSDEAYEALGTAGLYPAELAAKDARGKFWRVLRSTVDGNQRPNFIDIDGELEHTPQPRGPRSVSTPR